MARFRVKYASAVCLFSCVLLVAAASAAEQDRGDGRHNPVPATKAKEIQLLSGIAKETHPADGHDIVKAGRKTPSEAAAWWTLPQILAIFFASSSLLLAVLYWALRRRVRQQAETTRSQHNEAANCKRSAEMADRAKSEFLESVIHEIRAPLGGVIGMAQLALDTKLSVEQREYLLMVNSSADALLTVVNKILDFSKMEAGELEIESIPFTLADTLVGALRSICINAHEKGLELVYEIDPEVPARLTGDPGRLRQVLLTLVGNAIRCTDQGEVGLRVGLNKRDGQSLILQFSVYGSRTSVTSDHQRTASTPVEPSASYADGTLLGLSFAKQLIGLMEGSFRLNTEAGKGAVFHFTAGFKTCEPLEGGKGLSAGGARTADCQLLIVDDNATSRRILESLLSRMAVSYRSTDSGAAALQILQEERFQMVLLDMQMPEVDGFEVATQIRKRWSSEELKICLLTSMGVRGDAKRSRELSIDAYLVKPIDAFELAQAINEVLASKLSEETGGAPELITRHSLRERTFPQLATQFLSILVAEDNRVNQALARGLLEKQGHTVTIAANGQEAIQAFKAGAFDLILMDVQMPVMDGFEATRAIRLIEGKLRKTPIIALTAHAMASHQERCLAAGMDAFVSKPIHLRELSDCLAELGKKPVEVPLLTPQ